MANKVQEFPIKIDHATYKAVHQIQAARVAAGLKKPSLKDLVSEAIDLLLNSESSATESSPNEFQPQSKNQYQSPIERGKQLLLDSRKPVKRTRPA